MDAKLRGKVEDCARTSNDFIKLYYGAFDKRRHQVSRLYMENATFVWNGNAAQGTDLIQKYFMELPSSEHNIHTLDAQPVLAEAVDDQPTYLIQTSGSVKYTEVPVKAFQQTFLITAQNEKWKIVSDCYRIQDYLVNQDFTKK